MARSTRLRWFVSLLVAVAATLAGAQPSTFRITQVYSNLDGELQYVELTESAGLDGQHRLAGLTLTSRHNGVVKQFIFKDDLPTDRTAHMAIVVSNGSLPVLLYPSALHWHVPDVGAMPPRFLATDGGTLEFAGIDSMTYAALPDDGATALFRDGAMREATIPNNGRCSPLTRCGPRYKVVYSYAYAFEYYHAERDHYFVSASAPDIDALDSGRLTGWKRTGHYLSVGASSGAFPRLSQPVCRFYIPPGQGDSHFFSASTDECDTVRARFPEFISESTAAFHVSGLADPMTGACPTYFLEGVYPIVPVYRLWNRRVDSNHRYTTSIEIRDEMLQRGWMSEGHGSASVVMCTLGSPWDY